MRIGVLGGSFDPVHTGHTAMAVKTAQVFGLSRIIFLPAGISPFKPAGPAAAPEQRVEMLRLAIACTVWPDGVRAVISDADILREGKSYTFESLQIIRSTLPREDELFFIIGADSLLELSAWHKADELTSRFNIISIARPGFSVPDIIPGFTRKISERLKAGIVPDFNCDVSSSMIRDKIAKGLPLDGLVARPVAEYIQCHGLYRRPHE